MTSMLDQYDKTLKREDNDSKLSNELTNSGYVTVRIKDEAPIFVKQKMKLNLPADVLHLTVCNNWLVTLMSHQVLLRLYLVQPDRQDEVYLEKYMGGLKVSNLFLDPLGNHLLIALTPKSPGFTSELLYLHQKSNKPKKIEKFKDHEITAVAFNYENQSDTSTGSILIGTSKGLIFETEFSTEGERMFQNNWKQVFDVGRGEHCPIIGIEYHKVPNTLRYIIIVATLDRFYKFHEVLRPDDKPLLQNVFNSYLNVPEHIKDHIHHIENKFRYAKLRLNYESYGRFPKCFGWLTDAGIFYGEIDKSGDTPDFIVTNEMIPFPAVADGSANTESTSVTYSVNKKIDPLSFILTDFHALILYADHVSAVSLLNYQTVYEEYFTEQYGRMLDVVKDVANGTVYAFSGKSIFRYKITNEQRNVWRIYLDKNEYELAKLYCRDNRAHMDIVLVQQAELYFRQKHYTQSAEIYSETQSSFEDVCLKFLEINETAAMMIYLRSRLDTIKAQDKTQITMLVVWIIELFLTEMSHSAENPGKIRAMQKELDNFMGSPRVVECVRNNRGVIYELMASHGDNYNLTAFTTVNKDFEAVINQHINQINFLDALFVLKSQNEPDLYYKYSPILMERIPKETISAIILLGKKLDPIKLLPTLVSLESDDHVAEVIKYLEFCIHSLGCTELAIHNLLIKLYGQHKNQKMMTYLETQGRDMSMVHYDLHYALRVCEQHEVKDACVFLQCLLELWDPAVELALTFSTSLAHKTASQPPNRDLRRKLWLKIAEHEIREKNDVKEALNLLKECDLLRIEDLLPFFADFQKIDHFKNAICDALNEYNAKIQEQRKDMDESAKSAERVRSELVQFRSRSVTVAAQDHCSICASCLLTKPFYIFQCGHKFHSDCLERELIKNLSPEKNRTLQHLKQKLAASVTAQADTNSGNGSNSGNREDIKAEIENIMASDCLYCGEFAINNIDKPFIEDWDKVNVDWL